MKALVPDELWNLITPLPKHPHGPRGSPHRGPPPKHGSGIGVQRWVAEHVSALLNKFKRLRIPDDVKAEDYESFLYLGAVEINLGIFKHFCSEP
jgi:hypothetical protein